MKIWYKQFNGINFKVYMVLTILSFEIISCKHLNTESNSLGDKTVGDGGVAYKEGDRLVFADLIDRVKAVENGISIASIKESTDKSLLVFQQVSGEDVERGTCRYLNGYPYEPFLKDFMTRQMYWYFTNASLKKTHDTASRISDKLDQPILYQAAIHMKGVVIVQKKIFDHLSEINRCGLVIHELLRAVAYFSGVELNSDELMRLTEKIASKTSVQNEVLFKQLPHSFFKPSDIAYVNQKIIPLINSILNDRNPIEAINIDGSKEAVLDSMTVVYNAISAANLQASETKLFTQSDALVEMKTQVKAWIDGALRSSYENWSLKAAALDRVLGTSLLFQLWGRLGYTLSVKTIEIQAK